MHTGHGIFVQTITTKGVRDTCDVIGYHTILFFLCIVSFLHSYSTTAPLKINIYLSLRVVLCLGGALSVFLDHDLGMLVIFKPSGSPPVH